MMKYIVFSSTALVCTLALGIGPVQQSPPAGINPGTTGKALPEPTPPQRQLRLAILPDRTTGRNWGLKYLRMAVEDLNRVTPDAVLSIGDMIQGYTRSTEQWNRERDEFQSIVQQLRMPFYPLPGNHEVVSGTRDPRDQTFVEMYRESFGPLYYSVDFDLGTVICLFSDDLRFSNRPEGIGPDQLDWLRTALKNAQERELPIFILLHRPLWRSRQSGWNDLIHPLLVDAGVDAVIAGHFHSMQRDPDRDGVQYHLVAVCGGMIDQHPLTGQFQHLTLLHINDGGEFAIYHQPVGVTLPDNFIIAADQERAFRLKTMGSELVIHGALPDPLHEATQTTLDVEISNPVDVPVRVDVRLVDGVPGPTTWGDAMWLSRTNHDMFNPFVTEADTAVQLDESIEPTMISPGESLRTTLTISCEAQQQPIAPGELWFRFTFTDSHERSVPVIVRRRISIARTLTPAIDTPSPAYPICAWVPSVYDTEEPNPTARFWEEAEHLVVEVTVPDQTISHTEDDRPLARRLRDPMSDSIALRLSMNDQTTSYLVQPFGDTGIEPLTPPGQSVPNVMVKPVQRDQDGTWKVTLSIPWSDETMAINVGVADNDETYHTQWRWLTPEGLPLRIQRREAAAPVND